MTDAEKLSKLEKELATLQQQHQRFVNSTQQFLHALVQGAVNVDVRFARAFAQLNLPSDR